MFDNIGGKIKALAKIGFIVESIGCIISGIVLMADSDLIGLGLLVMLLGPCVAWVASWFVYGYGELIDKAYAIEQNTRRQTRKSAVQTQAESTRLEKLEALRKKGLITEEEFKQAMAREMTE